MTVSRCHLAIVATVGLMAVSCGGDDTSPVASEPSRSELSEVLFDQTVVHDVAMEISDDDLGLLDPPTDDRVPVDLTVDGVTADGAGVRLKQGSSQFQGLDAKPGFSIETDEFVDGLELFDVDRFTLGNATWDHSFVAEQLVYELYRGAGIPAARTALARVRLNGETFGLYVMRETYDERWLAQYFDDPTGNLYETSGECAGHRARTAHQRTSQRHQRPRRRGRGGRNGIRRGLPGCDRGTRRRRRTADLLGDRGVDGPLGRLRVRHHRPGSGPAARPTGRQSVAEQLLQLPRPRDRPVRVHPPWCGSQPSDSERDRTTTSIPRRRSSSRPNNVPRSLHDCGTTRRSGTSWRSASSGCSTRSGTSQALTERADLLADLVRADGLTGSRESVTMAAVRGRAGRPQGLPDPSS